MITMFWLIRSFQGINKGSENVWQDDWFIGVIFTIVCTLLDLSIISLFVGILS